jgi:hypothetical protein
MNNIQPHFFPAVPIQKTTFRQISLAIQSLFFDNVIHPSLALHINF